MRRTYIAVGDHIDTAYGKFDREWASTGGEGDETGGWVRYLNWLNDRTIEFEYGADKRITRVWSNGYLTDRTYL